MVDIHSHVLPGIDDGSKSMEETVEMIRMAREHGTTLLVASPHADTQYSYDSTHIEELLAEARAFAGPGIELVRGCDFHLMFDNIEAALRQPMHYTINQKGYLLMELSDLTIFPNTGDLWSQLEDAGMTIVLTHPERNPLLRQRLELIQEWVGQGRYMQVTGQSLLGLFGKKAQEFARQLLDLGLVHFIASDAHDLQGRPPRLDQAFQWISENYSPRLAELLCVEHPAAAVRGEALDLSEFPPPLMPRKTGFWSKLFKR
ncbi:CpsB/CapC family capsule biosynthesis tyrosine phosphatase [uncultured Paludibaculum sp.]|uniref:tyrosine-protein phosphatase n=1 Tax=uncultured Paludibaculum sp. TaxID=1765020 RepID=UPI002AAAD3BB|nr:CpsB/CapC family capsule biosynthesis tyrosine phosphatase [uncultured Paludibaculum sp.]